MGELVPKGPFPLSSESGKEDGDSISHLAERFDLLDVLETAWPRVWDDGNESDSSFLEGMLTEQFKVMTDEHCGKQSNDGLASISEILVALFRTLIIVISDQAEPHLHIGELRRKLATISVI